MAALTSTLGNCLVFVDFSTLLDPPPPLLTFLKKNKKKHSCFLVSGPHFYWYNMSKHHRDWDLACKVYIGNLSREVDRYEVEDLFARYGPLRNVWVARNPPGFGFI